MNWTERFRAALWRPPSSWRAGRRRARAPRPAAAQTAADLGKTLTPIGAIKAGNADKTIPAYDGGITTPPAGYKPGDHQPDPFADDKPLFTINAANMAQYADKLIARSEGDARALPRLLPNGLPDPAQRRACRSAIYDKTIANATTRQAHRRRQRRRGRRRGIPFPIPQNGLEAIWNHLLRYRGVSLHRSTAQVTPTAGGDYIADPHRREVLLRLRHGGDARQHRQRPDLLLQAVTGAAAPRRHDAPGARDHQPGGRAAPGLDLQPGPAPRAPRAERRL